MFTKMKNIETAFRYIRMVSLMLIAGSILLSSWVVYWSWTMVGTMQDQIYILADGKVLEAMASKRSENIPVEAKEHIRAFHRYFFTLDPDDQAIRITLGKAMYLADETAKKSYDNLKEQGYYANLISGNINQTIQVDSIQLDTEVYPYRFRCYATQQIVRPTSKTIRLLVTQGALRMVSRSDHNPHGFLIERWKTLDNRDVKTEVRR